LTNRNTYLIDIVVFHPSTAYLSHITKNVLSNIIYSLAVNILNSVFIQAVVRLFRPTQQRRIIMHA